MIARCTALAAITLLVGCALVRHQAVVHHGEGEPDEVAPFSRFDHNEHEALLSQAGWTCEACHLLGGLPDGEPKPLGFEMSPEEDRAILLPPPRLCHTCHAPGATADGPTRCRLCHEEGENEAPESHDAGWMTSHDREALLHPDGCSDCHESWTCVRCHVRRDRIGTEVHPGTWIALHGIAARTDPVSCEDCHEGASCTQCHVDEAGLRGW